ncbi:ribosomal protein L31 [Streptomyces qinglanensis]|uniref:Large ribosomal subunit protein bL31B n=1 Tax=Streptomyces qinglanensis TaxID=943816 RepID=A0A1H9TGW1_9ACTN|nr:ribosomal protein L31 [Streptomyces qinglanensis]
MKSDTHPDYREVVFRDRSAGYAFLTRSTAASDTVIEWDDGRTYPVVDVEISSESHPFHTGKARVVDSEGQIAKFRQRYEGTTPDEILHSAPESDPTPEDLVLASGRDLSEENLQWARERIAAEGRAAMERRLP